MVNFKKNINIKKIQKNRNFDKPKKLKVIFGDYGLISRNTGRIELIHIKTIKRFFRKLIFKNKNKFSKKLILSKIWFFNKSNFFLQKKSKNSRMGKGCGNYLRKTIRIFKNSIIFEFKGVTIIQILKFIKFINQKLDIKFYLINKNYKFNNLWNKPSYLLYFYKKYLISSFL